MIASSSIGGAERALATVVRTLDPTRVRTTVACHGPGPMLAEYRRDAADALPVDLGRVFDPRLVDRLARVMSEVRPDIVHTHLWNADVLGALAARRARVPVVVSTVQGAYHPLLGARGIVRARRRLLGLTYRAIYRRFDRVIAVSRYVRDDLVSRRGLRVVAGRVVVIPNALDRELLASTDAPVGARGPGRRVVSVANLVPVKGHEWLLRALPSLRARCPDVGLVLVGDGPCRARLECLARDLGISDSVVFAGTVADPVPLVRASDVFVLPSLAEGLPLALLEALAVGTPVVASRAGGIPEVVEDERTALLVAPGDATGLAHAIARVLDDPALGGRLAAAGRTAARERFAAPVVVPRLSALYEELVRSTAAR